MRSQGNNRKNPCTNALEQVKRLKDHIEAENSYLREEINVENNFAEVNRK